MIIVVAVVMDDGCVLFLACLLYVSKGKEVMKNGGES